MLRLTVNRKRSSASSSSRSPSTTRGLVRRAAPGQRQRGKEIIDTLRRLSLPAHTKIVSKGWYAEVEF